jgi:hypothetical protein
MAFFDEEQLAQLRIDRMIFHVVGPEEHQLVLLDEFLPGEHADFFLDRLRSTNAGLTFDFLQASPLLTSLRKIVGDAGEFVDETHELARLFKTHHGGSSSAGVFMIFQLSAADARFFALVKYDHQSVLSYRIQETGDGGHRALVAALQETFVKSPEALQKSALIRLTDEGGELCIRDRSAPSSISNYFGAFLGVQRRFEAEKLTTMLRDITKKVANDNSELLGPAIVRNVNQRVYEAIQAHDSFAPETKELFLTAVFGALPADHKVRADFDKELGRARIQAEAFDFVKDAVRRPAKRHLVTTENIEVIWEAEYNNLVRQEIMEDGRTRITIEVAGIRVDDDYPDQRTRAR